MSGGKRLCYSRNVAPDKQITAIRNLIHEGMRLAVESRRDIAETSKDMRALAPAQK
jgi:hypothetical protein